MDQDKKLNQEDMEVSGSLTPELNRALRAHVHPYRYAGQDPEGAPPRGLDMGTEQ